MGYSPTLGRWLEQDPIGDPNIVGPGAAAVAVQAEQAAMTRIASRLGKTCASDQWLWEYAAGANRYEFVSSNPVTLTDASGLFLSPHHYVLTWITGLMAGMPLSCINKAANRSVAVDFDPGFTKHKCQRHEQTCDGGN